MSELETAALQRFTCIKCSIEKDRIFYYESRLKRNSYICKPCSTVLRVNTQRNEPTRRIAVRLRKRKTPLGTKVLRAILGVYAAESDEHRRAVDADEVDVVARGGGVLTEHNAEVVLRSRRRG